ncbi:MAG: acetyl-CoA carboxylase biotin carboxylase subunit [Deltaproteobacteria bacterium]|nr:acetyl-CoA carboxylase biotin carboxylase subunit [Deltaproteobacteria bacterium]
MFKKVLIANRGEIAVRIIRACRALNITSVAVYSTADREALHVRLADERVCIGPPIPAASYLNIPAIVSAALSFGADAVHPGYGFLSENGDFAEACQRSGLVFIGPRVRNIRIMGDKPRARRIMERARVPVLPGTSSGTTEVREAQAVAAQVGFPVLIKAAAGGGGRGLRIARSAAELTAVFSVAREEGEAAFGDGALYVEKYLDRARHIEFQIIADQHRNVLHLGERECSIQRRYQKIVEEAPSPALNKRLRDRMGAIAVQAAQAVGYTNVGTIEFLLDAQGHFYFIEMNTRVQVEHPVTEMVTGIDIVQAGIQAASGEPLPWRQRDITFSGHALECRIVAEDPVSMLPSPGTIRGYHAPGGMGIRVESGVAENSVVPVYYDSLIAKVIASGRTREEAIQRMRGALSEYQIGGIKTNIALHQQILNDPEFLAGDVHTRYLDKFLNRRSTVRDSAPAAEPRVSPA